MFKTLYCCPRTIARHENGLYANLGGPISGT
jgi:hypothetical protein